MQPQKKVFVVTAEFTDPKTKFKFGVRAHIMADTEVQAKVKLAEWGESHGWERGPARVQLLTDQVVS